MKISKENFFSVGSDVNIPIEQLQVFWKLLEKVHHFSKLPYQYSTLTQLLFFLGILILISAMSWLMSMGWEMFGGGGIFFISFGYAVLFILIGQSLWNKERLRMPAGLFITLAVCMIPLAIYGLETYFNFESLYDHSHNSDFYVLLDREWIFIELGTMLAGGIALFFFPSPLIIVPIFFATGFLTMDVAPLLFGHQLNWEQQRWIALCLGVIWMTAGRIFDKRKMPDYASWSYLFGTLFFWGSLNALVWDKGEFTLFLYFLINLLMMLFSILLKRNVLMIAGTTGVFIYLSYQAHVIFKNSVSFPFILSFIGLGLVYLSILYQKNQRWIEKNLFNKLPFWLRKFFN
ncbi:hypothetical protein [Candidatus Protochlamydia sp. W-9]|uniref:hypothetical protein n=1 Tax=Candidatus Protochlamydia sp. W-9 TaxID=1785087 RepID=UPI00096ABC0A|nr:hypothetical protein [Candidatus Protochlamydia sp. W-9]